MPALGSTRAVYMSLALTAAFFLAPPPPAEAQSQSYIKLSAGDMSGSTPIQLGISKSVVVDLPRAASDVLISDPKIADAVLRTATRLYLIGAEVGQASVFLFDAAGAQIASFDIFVELDLSGLNQLLAEAIPGGYVRADAVNKGIVLRGEVTSASDAARAVSITTQMLPQLVTAVTNANISATATAQQSTQEFDPNSGPGIVNLINITGEDQVALKVTIAEVQRSVVKQLGINLKGAFTDGGFGVGTNLTGPLGDVATGLGLSPITFPFSPSTTPGEFGIGYSDGNGTIQATLQALEETSMLRTLAEPTLTAVSGETANFLAGGEFPVPVAGDEGEITVEFKPFGVNLAFTPIVLSSGRISIKVRSEVSNISATGAVSVPISSSSTVTIPAISVRRAETTVEQQSGGAFVIAGLIQEDTRRAISGFPALQKIPILGALFSSKDYLQDETELVMIVTPYLVKPVAPQELARPSDNLVMANDVEALLFNKLTQVYGRAEAAPAAGAAGRVGFTFD